MCVRREPAHVDPDLGDDDVGAEVLDARDHDIINFRLRCERVQGSPRTSRVERGHSCIESIDLIQMKAQQEAMVLRHAAAKRPRGDSSCDAFTFADRQGRPGFGGIGFAGNQCLDHCTATLPPIKSESTESNLMLASSSVFCTRNTWLDCSRTTIAYACAAGCASPWVCVSGTKLAADQTVRQQFGQPHSIVDVGFAARHVLHVRGVCPTPTRTPLIIQDVPHWLPVNAGRLHRHMRAIVCRQPLPTSAEGPPWSSGRYTNFSRDLAIGYKA